MIDLHVHTKYSDGTDDVPELLARAEAAGLECISITDHNDCRAYEVLCKLNVKDYYSGRIIPGCEFNASIQGILIEILGYKVDMNVLSAKLPDYYSPSSQQRSLEFQRILEVCRKCGVTMDENAINFNPVVHTSEECIHKEIVRHPENKKFFVSEKAWQDENAFYRLCLSNPKDVFYIDYSDLYPSAAQVVNLIKEAGGLVFIPHIYQYGENSEMIFQTLMRDYPIDGIECYYKMYSDEQTRFLINFCRENHLYMSGGTDYHGEARPGVKLGLGRGNLDIPFSLVADWVDK